MRVRLATVMADKIVPGRNVQVTDFHQRQQYLKTLQMEEAESIRQNIQEQLYDMLSRRQSVWFG